MNDVNFWLFCHNVSKELGDETVAHNCYRLYQLWREGKTVDEAIRQVTGWSVSKLDERIRELGVDHRIQAVKEYRSITGCGLKEARDYVYMVLGLPV